jgi:hypothetical protein
LKFIEIENGKEKTGRKKTGNKKEDTIHYITYILA